MKIENIVKILNENQISEFPYKKQNGINHNQLWIEKKQEDWRAYYVERGEKNLLEKFENEDQACKFFLDSLINNNAVKIDFDTVYRRKWRLKKIKKGRKKIYTRNSRLFFKAINRNIRVEFEIKNGALYNTNQNIEIAYKLNYGFKYKKDKLVLYRLDETVKIKISKFKFRIERIIDFIEKIGRKIGIKKSNKKLLQDIRSDLNDSIYLKVLDLLND